MVLVFATHNTNKFQEVRELLPSGIILNSLNEIGCAEEILENGNTLEENAKIKADYVSDNYGLPCFADDTGLIVDSLKGEPGVLSARYAGEQKNADDNMEKLLKNLEKVKDRSARFETVIALNLPDGTITFKGTVEGKIIHEKKGKQGFGYDPIFIPKGYDKTFAELPLRIKNEIGHRGKAIQKLVRYLSKMEQKT